tara:strand:- start:1124 stop:1789 length:666 start_codon:yes stop_codon:yes gene_type:complete
MYISSSSDWNWNWETDSIATQTSENTPKTYLEVPEWVSFESLDFQKIWQDTSGKRHQQPQKEREKYEKLWLQNTELPITTYQKHNSFYDNIQKHIYSVMALRSFTQTGPYGIQITHFRIVDDIKTQLYCEYLVKFKTPRYEYSSWMRYSKLKLFYNHLFLHYSYLSFKNTRLSWKVLNSWKSWFRNLEMSYLQKKAFFLERILHDALYEIDDPYIFILYFT